MSPSGSATSRRSGGLDLQIRQGEFFSMLGPSGCGKTTTLRLIAGFEQPTEGAIRLDGEDVARSRRTSATSTRCSSPTRCSTTSTSRRTSRSACGAARSRRRRSRTRVAEALELVALGHRAKDEAGPALGRQAPAGRAGPRAREPAVGAAARRAARRARPPAAQADAGRAQADPARGRDHVHLRDARPGGGAGHVRPHRGHARRRRRAARRARGDLRAPGQAVRGRLHRHLEPAAGDGRERRRAARAPARWSRRRSRTA